MHVIKGYLEMPYISQMQIMELPRSHRKHCCCRIYSDHFSGLEHIGYKENEVLVPNIFAREHMIWGQDICKCWLGCSIYQFLRESKINRRVMFHHLCKLYDTPLKFSELDVLLTLSFDFSSSSLLFIHHLFTMSLYWPCCGLKSQITFLKPTQHISFNYYSN